MTTHPPPISLVGLISLDDDPSPRRGGGALWVSGPKLFDGAMACVGGRVAAGRLNSESHFSTNISSGSAAVGPRGGSVSTTNSNEAPPPPLACGRRIFTRDGSRSCL